MTGEEAISWYQKRRARGLIMDPHDVEEQASIVLEDYPGEVEIKTVESFGLVRLFLRVPGGEWLSRYAWDRETVHALVCRFRREMC